MQRTTDVPVSPGGSAGGGRFRVILVQPLPVVREALGLLIETQPDLTVVVSARNGDDALRDLERMSHKKTLVALVSLDLTGEHDAFWLISLLRQRFPWVRVAASGASADRMSISRALFVGADGVIDKRADPIDFLDGLRRCAAGEMVLTGVPKDWLGPIADGVEQHASDPSPLTEREREVLSVAAEGLRAKEIALRLGVAERTVTTHLARIYGKLGVNSRVGAVTTAARVGLVRVASPFEDPLDRSVG